MGMMSSKIDDNSFYNWNKVLIGYCDGSFHQGYNKDAKYLYEPLYFRGDINSKSILNDVLEN